MPAPDLSADLGEPTPEDLIEAGVYPSEREVAEHGLVVLALGQPYWIFSDGDAHRLLVERSAIEPVRAQLAAYDRERIGWPPPPIVDPAAPGKAEVLTPLLWSALVLVVFEKQGPWVDAGLLDSRALFERHEWWRIATALFLHADAAHVISNALGGILVFTAVLSTMGRLRGWLLVAAASLSANFLVAAAQYPSAYQSLGASTAIFAGVGLLTGRAIRLVARNRHPHRWRAMFGPFAAGLTILALYGAGGVRVDVGAHLAGSCTGVAFGFIAGLRRVPR